MKGKCVVLTGGTDGIGAVTARDVVAQGADLVLLCRSMDKGEAVRRSISAATGRDAVELVHCELGDLDSVRAAAAEVLERCQRLDVLVNNAGGAMKRRTTTSQGHELTLAVNHLGPYLLTRLLLDRVLAAEAPRIVFTSSRGHFHSALDFDDLDLSRGWTIMKAYGRTKLMNLLTAMELHRRHGDQGLAASSMHPGGVRTGIWNKAGLLGRIVGIVGGLFMISSEEGADTLTWLATSPEAAAPAGQYYYQRKARRKAPFATDEAARRLWDVSAERAGLGTPSP